MADITKVLTGLECLITNEVPCEGCPWYGSGFCTKSIARESYKLLKEQNTTRHALEVLVSHGWDAENWISVNSRLPVVGEDVLVCARNKISGEADIMITSMYDQTYYTSEPVKHEPRWREPYQYFNSRNKITHWRSLPVLPKET